MHLIECLLKARENELTPQPLFSLVIEFSPIDLIPSYREFYQASLLIVVHVLIHAIRFIWTIAAKKNKDKTLNGVLPSIVLRDP